MASTYTNGGIELIGDDEQSSAWGDTTNTNLQMLDKMKDQRESITIADADATLTVVDGELTTTDRKSAYLHFEGTLTANRTMTIAPTDMQKIYYIHNATTGGFGVIIAQGTGDTVSVPPGAKAIVYLDGAGDAAAVTKLGVYSSGLENNFYVPSVDMWAKAAAGAAEVVVDAVGGATNRAVRTWDFDAASSEFVYFEKQMPADWDGGNMTFEPIWSPLTATSGDVRWRVQAIAYSDQFDWDAASWSSDYASLVTTAQASLTIHMGDQSATPDGLFTAGSPATAGSIILFSVHRDASHAEDTMTADAKLHGIRIYYNEATACTC